VEIASNHVKGFVSCMRIDNLKRQKYYRENIFYCEQSQMQVDCSLALLQIAVSFRDFPQSLNR